MGEQFVHGHHRDALDVFGLVGEHRYAPGDTGHDIPGDVHDVAYHRACRGQLPGAVPAQQDIADGVAGYHDRIEDPVDLGELVALRNHGGMHPGFDFAVVVFSDGQQLDPVAELTGKVDVDGRYLGDALGVGIGQVYLHAECQGGDDRQFMGGIMALNIQSRVGFGVAFRLGLGQNLGKLAALIGYPGQDVIARPVENPCHRPDVIADQRFPERLDNGHTTADTGFIGQVDVDFPCFFNQGVALGSHERFIGGHHMFAVLHGLEDQVLGDALPADHLHDDIDVGVFHNGKRVADKDPVIKGKAPIGGRINVRHILQMKVGSQPGLDQRPIFQQQLGHAHTNRAAAQ